MKLDYYGELWQAYLTLNESDMQLLHIHTTLTDAEGKKVALSKWDESEFQRDKEISRKLIWVSVWKEICHNFLKGWVAIERVDGGSLSLEIVKAS